MVDDAPEDIRKLKYSKISLEKQFTYYVYSELQWNELFIAKIKA